MRLRLVRGARVDGRPASSTRIKPSMTLYPTAVGLIANANANNTPAAASHPRLSVSPYSRSAARLSIKNARHGTSPYTVRAYVKKYSSVAVSANTNGIA